MCKTFLENESLYLVYERVDVSLLFAFCTPKSSWACSKIMGLKYDVQDEPRTADAVRNKLDGQFVGPREWIELWQVGLMACLPGNI